jgi:hypothetical protein
MLVGGSHRETETYTRHTRADTGVWTLRDAPPTYTQRESTSFCTSTQRERHTLTRTIVTAHSPHRHTDTSAQREATRTAALTTFTHARTDRPTATTLRTFRYTSSSPLPHITQSVHHRQTPFTSHYRLLTTTGYYYTPRTTTTTHSLARSPLPVTHHLHFVLSC